MKTNMIRMSILINVILFWPTKKDPKYQPDPLKKPWHMCATPQGTARLTRFSVGRSASSASTSPAAPEKPWGFGSN